MSCPGAGRPGPWLISKPNRSPNWRPTARRRKPPGSGEGPAPIRSSGAPDEAQRPLVEAGEGEAEGFELAEQDLAEHASHGDQHAARRAIEDAPPEGDDRLATEGGEADQQYSSQREDDR